MSAPQNFPVTAVLEKKRGKHRKNYGLDDLLKAYHAVTQEKWPVMKAARVYGVPAATIHDRLTGRMKLEKDKLPVMGSARLLNEEEERTLAEHFEHMSYLGYEYIQRDIVVISSDYAVALNKKKLSESGLSQGWFRWFRGRFPNIRLKRYHTSLSTERANATSAGTVSIYYTNLKAILDSSENEPSSIYILDEVTLPMEQNAADVYVKGEFADNEKSNKDTESFTLIGCANASGSLVPPFIVLPGKKWNDLYLEGTCPGSDGECSQDGDTNAHVFNNYFNNHFRKFVPFGKDKRPIIVLYDGQKINLMLTLKTFGEENNITFFVLPPHTSCITGLNLDCFHPITEVFKKESQLYCRKSNLLSLHNQAASKLASKSYLKAMTPAAIMAGFKRIGVYPFDSNVVRPSEAVLEDDSVDFAGFINQTN